MSSTNMANVIARLEKLNDSRRLRVVTELIYTLGDEDLDSVGAALRDAYRVKRDDRARAATESLREGDRVVVSRIKPKALDGAEAVVTRTPPPGAKHVYCRWDDASLLFRRTRRAVNGQETRLPASCLTKVEA